MWRILGCHAIIYLPAFRRGIVLSTSVLISQWDVHCYNKVGLNVAAPTYDGRTEIPSYSIEFLSVTLHYRIRHSKMTVGM